LVRPQLGRRSLRGSPPGCSILRQFRQRETRYTIIFGRSAITANPPFISPYDFARDYLGLLKAAVIASGLIPSGMEGSSLGSRWRTSSEHRTGGGPGNRFRHRFRHCRGVVAAEHQKRIIFFEGA
jgi:hypothetical protein